MQLTIIKGEQPPAGAKCLKVPVPLSEYPPTDKVIEIAVLTVRGATGKVWRWKNTKCGYVCYEQETR